MDRLRVFHNELIIIKLVYRYRTIMVNNLKENVIRLLGWSMKIGEKVFIGL
jgi:hypothetical protein